MKTMSHNNSDTFFHTIHSGECYSIFTVSTVIKCIVMCSFATCCIKAMREQDSLSPLSITDITIDFIMVFQST